MATQLTSRSILRRPGKSFSGIFTRYFSSSSPLANSPAASRSASSWLHRSRTLVAGFSSRIVPTGVFSSRDLSTQSTSSSLNDPSRNSSNRPSNETILLDGCDFEHWLVVMEAPEGDLSRDEIIDSYIKTLAQVVGSEEEARMKIYSVSSRCYYAFGALVSEDVSLKLKDLPKVKWVLPDSYLDVNNKDYGGEPFVNGKAVPYDPKYHEEWMRNNSAANDRNKRNDRKGNRDRSRSFERRNVSGNQDMGYNYRAPPPNQGHMGNNNPNMPPHTPPPNMNQQHYRGPPPPNMNQQHYRGPPPPNMNQNYQGKPTPNMGQNYSGPPQQPPNMNGGGYQGQGQGGVMQQQQPPYPPNRDQY